LKYLGHSLVRRCLQQVRLARGHASKCIPGANLRDGAFIAIDASVVAHLEEKGAVTKPVAALDAFGATDAEPLINDVFVIGVFDEGALDCGGRTKLIFSARVERVWFRFEISGAELAIAADGMGMNAFDGGLLEDAMGGAVVAANASGGVNLPDGALGGASANEKAGQSPQPSECCGSRSIPYKSAARNRGGRRVGVHGLALWLWLKHPHIGGDQVEHINPAFGISDGVESANRAVLRTASRRVFDEGFSASDD